MDQMYVIRKIGGEEVEEALALAREVFLEFEAPDYQPEGVEVFQRFIENEDFILKCKEGICPIYAAFDEGKMIGMMGVRQNRAHITMAFVRKEYHRRGVATGLFRFLLEDVLRENPALKEITLNSSPYGKPFYLHIGCLPLSEEVEMGGVRFTPMKYVI